MELSPCLDSLWGLSAPLRASRHPSCCPGMPAWPHAERGQVSALPCGLYWGVAYPGALGIQLSCVFCLPAVAVPAFFFRALDKAIVKVPGLWRWTNPNLTSGLGLITCCSTSASGLPTCPAWRMGNHRIPMWPLSLDTAFRPRRSAPSLVSHMNTRPLWELCSLLQLLSRKRDSSFSVLRSSTHLIHGLYGTWKLQLFNDFKHPPYTVSCSLQIFTIKVFLLEKDGYLFSDCPKNQQFLSGIQRSSTV